jgi:hypothetical protein
MLSLYSGDKNKEEDCEEGIYIHYYRPAGRVFNYLVTSEAANLFDRGIPSGGVSGCSS